MNNLQTKLLDRFRFCSLIGININILTNKSTISDHKQVRHILQWNQKEFNSPLYWVKRRGQRERDREKEGERDWSTEDIFYISYDRGRKKETKRDRERQREKEREREREYIFCGYYILRFVYNE